jgi:hypothetical protein
MRHMFPHKAFHDMVEQVASGEGICRLIARTGIPSLPGGHCNGGGLADGQAVLLADGWAAVCVRYGVWHGVIQTLLCRIHMADRSPHAYGFFTCQKEKGCTKKASLKQSASRANGRAFRHGENGSLPTEIVLIGRRRCIWGLLR